MSATRRSAPTTITLTWTASTDSQSYVDHYVVYRNGSAIGTSATASYSDTSVQAATNYSYQVSAVNRDGFESGQSAAVTVGVPGIVSYDWPDNQHIEIYFSEPLNPATAGVLSNYVLHRRHVQRRRPVPRQHDGHPDHQLRP